MKNTIFKGFATALVTPMTSTGVDYDTLARFIDFQIENGINALVAVGTTGESATLEPDEQRQVIRFTVEKVAGRVPVVAGTGTNDTSHVLRNTVNACQAGADAVLVVTPYYNKATQNGLIAHFTAVADASTKPVILYNVPGRTGCNLLPKTVAKLAEHPNIVGIKEATGNMAQMVELVHLCGDKLDIYSGEDGLVTMLLGAGGIGVISVVANIMPEYMHTMVKTFLDGDQKTAWDMQIKVLDLVNALFCEVNPIPVKEAMCMMGYDVGRCRMPLSPLNEKNKALLREVLEKHNMI